MVPDVTLRRIAAGSALVGGVALAIVTYAILTHEPANDGGTSIAGLFFAIVFLAALPPLAEAGVLAAVLRWGRPPRGRVASSRSAPSSARSARRT